MVGVMEQSSGVATTGSGYSKLYSSTYETGQNDSGSLKGFFKRDHQFHLVPYRVSSFDTSTVTSTSTFDSLLSFALPTQVGSAPAVTWPMLDTPGHQAAYAYLSNAIVGKVLFANGTCTVDAAWCDDVRAWYAGSEVKTFAGLDLSASPAYAFPSSASGFTQSDFNDVKSQLQSEFIYLNNELNYESWFISVTNGTLLNTGSAFSAAANDVSSSLISQYATITPPPISVASGLLSFAGDAFSVFGNSSNVDGGDEEAVSFPEASVMSDVLGIVSTFVSLSGDQSGTDPSVVQVGDLITSVDGQASLAAAKYNLALQAQVSNNFAGVRSDWFKLQTFGILTSQPSANGWYVQDTGGATASTLAALSTARARVSFYSQLLPKYFVMDWMNAVPVQGIVNSGTSLSVLNSQYINLYLGSQYYQGYGGTWPAPDFSQFSLPSAVNSTCQDYGLVASQYSVSHYDADNAVFLQSWQNPLGDVLMGPPSSADGLGNLNLSQNTVYDLEFNTILSPVLHTSIYAPNQFAGLPWGQNISCPNGLGAAATAQLRTTVIAPPSATLTIQPSGSRVAPDGSVTVAVSVQPADPTVTLIPTGTISIASGTKFITTKSLTTGTPPMATATLKILAGYLSPGMYSLTVGYGGDSNFLGSTATMNLQVLVAAAATTTTLNMPAVAYQGQNVTFQTTVTSATGIPPGTVNFQDGTTSLGSVLLDSTGSASISLSDLGVGSHSITALYTPTDSLVYAASQSQIATLLINPVAQDMSLSLSTSSVDVPAGARSAAVKLTVSSVSSFAGQVSFACVGLPLGMTCNFSPSQGSLPASGAVSTNLTISQNATTSSAGIYSWKGSAGLLGFILSAVLAFRISRGRRLIGGAVWMWAMFTLSVAMLSGCGGGVPRVQPTKPEQLISW